jgi:hypothetical protein
MIQIGNKQVIEVDDIEHFYKPIIMTDVQIDIHQNFKTYFDSYLKSEYGITEEEFKKIIKNAGAEYFI